MTTGLGSDHETERSVAVDCGPLMASLALESAHPRDQMGGRLRESPKDQTMDDDVKATAALDGQSIEVRLLGHSVDLTIKQAESLTGQLRSNLIAAEARRRGRERRQSLVF